MRSILSFILALSLMLCLSACNSKDKEAATVVPAGQTQEAGDNSVKGTVVSISEAAITILTESGEQTYSLTASTLYYRELTMGDRRPEPMLPEGESFPKDGQQPPEMPADGQQPPEMPADGQQPPEMPADGQQPPEMPADGQQPPEMPADGQQPPEMPADGQQPPEMPTDGQQPSDSGNGGFTPGNGGQGQAPAGGEGFVPPTGEGDKGFGDPNGGRRPKEPQAITREEVSVGDTVTLALDKGGTVLSLTVKGGMTGNMGQPPMLGESGETTQP